MMMDKPHLLTNEIVDPVSYMCVDPNDVNPVSRSSDSPSATLLADIPVKVESSLLLQSPCAIGGGVFYAPQRRVKLEMEEFGDLSLFVSQKRMTSNSIDELNTPIFEKDDAFDFDISNYQTNVQADLHVMLTYDAFYRENGAFNNPNIIRQEDIFLNSESLHRNAIAAFNNNQQQQQQYSDGNIYSPPASDNGTYIEKMSPNTSTMFDLDMNSSVSVNNCNSRHSSYPPSPTGFSSMPIVMETPEGSERSFRSGASSKPRLSLDVGLENQANNSINLLDINTPSIIAEVVSLEATGFNILDLINEDNIDLVDEDVFPTPSTQSRPQLHQPKVIEHFDTVAVKQPRKRRLKIEDDEDYVPPTKKNSRHAVSRSNRSVRKYSDSESEEEGKPLRKPRGRPPKRTESVSSDCSKDSDVSKYRELRDKNNEASRKSRQKRRTKEQELEKEADDLHSKNIKLKAQVGELEKMVNNFRDNLFKIMINK